MDKQSDFDFPSWLTKPDFPHPFRNCVRAAADALSLGQGRLRTRLNSALGCLCFCDGRDVPKKLQSEFDSVRHEIQQRTGAGEDVQLWNIDLGELRRSLRRCSLNTARRLASTIIAWDRVLADKDGGAHKT
jgi:hypothetical protein